ncbi:hypothetical protein CDAR_87441 [Caerostris darwini]|uniref:Uncharacterized protein n=1 Tax=Caerostris darwini TaxID=1538125 RepID=A0AAV4UNH1_9ARAC|nr:hypothetical protein CDAR_87441 [Caerostris darwini]
MLPYPIREAAPSNRENELAVHQRPLVVCNQSSGESPNFLNDHHCDEGVMSHDSLELNREMGFLLHRTQRIEDLHLAHLALDGPARNLRTTEKVYEYSSNSVQRRNATPWRFRIRRFLSRMQSKARSLFRL